MKNYVVGSGNVFKDIGSKNPEEKLAKAEIAFIINRIIKERGLTQKEAAKTLAVDQPKISALKHGKLSGFSLERLFAFLGALDQNIDIVVRDSSKKETKKTIHIEYA